MSILKKYAVKAIRSAIDNSPKIFAITAIGCAFGAAYGFVKATVKSKEAIDDRNTRIEKVDGDNTIDDAAKKELKKQINIGCAKEIAPNYIIPAVTLAVEVAAIVGCHKGHGKKEAIMAASLNLINSNAEEILKKSEEVIGKKKFQTIKDQVDQEKMEKLAKSNPYIIETGKGSEIFVHEPTGQVFRSSKSYVERCINMVDAQLSSGKEDFVEMNWLLEEWNCNKCEFGRLSGFPASKFTQYTNSQPLYDQVRFVNWENPDTGEVWKIIKHPYEIYADGNYISIPAY